MFITFKKWTAIYWACLALMVCVFAIIWGYGDPMPVSAEMEYMPDFRVLIIDPGHGGEDGGAVGTDGTVESKINLEIAMKIAELVRFIGWDVCMTRTEDISIHDAEAETLRQKKVSDLKNRVDFCDSIENGILISIHQNTLPGSTKVRGAQVFYNSVEGSRELAIYIQERLNQVINEGNGKEAKNIGSTSYLMKNVACPAVLIECGFLSNPDECDLLNSEEYQRKIALTVVNALSRADAN